MNRDVLNFFLALALSVLFVGSIVSNVAASPTLAVVPGTKDALVGDTFMVSINLDYVADLFGFDITLTFDKTKLNATALDYTGYLGTGSNIFSISAVNNTGGYVNLAVSRLVPSGVTGGGDLAVVHFKCIGTGTCALHLDHTILAVYPTGSAVAHSTSDGQVTISGPPQYHELAVTSSPLTGIPFTINSTSKTTPYSESLLEGSYTLEMPQTYNGYKWSKWLEDGYTNRIRTVTLNADITLTGVYTASPPSNRTFSLMIDSIPTGVTFMVDGTSYTAPWLRSYLEGASVNIVMPETHTIGMTKYFWDGWNDGVSSRSRTVSIYADISLTAKYKLSASPVAEFSFTPEKPRVNETILFDASSSHISGNETSFRWNFGDGNTTTVSVPTVSHAYSSVGRYAVNLNVTENGMWNDSSSQITVTFATDLNKDEKVDILDISLVAVAFGSKPGGPKWNALADLDKNGQVNIVDVAMVAKNYGKKV